MKKINDLIKATTELGLADVQFNAYGNEKNILYLYPQLSGKDLYRVFLPYFKLQSDRVKTAVLFPRKYSATNYLDVLDFSEITDEQLIWADYIVLPFTLNKIDKEFIDRINNLPNIIKLIYFFDFNIYEIPEYSSLKYLVNDTIIKNVEYNVSVSDIILVTNIELMFYLSDKYKEDKVIIDVMPINIDVELISENMEHYLEKPTFVENISQITESVKNGRKKSRKKSTGKAKSGNKGTSKKSSSKSGNVEATGTTESGDKPNTDTTDK